MARATQARATKEPSREEIERLVALITTEVRREGSVACSGLSRLGVAKNARGPVLDAVRQRGFEVTTRVVRVPVREQLAERLEKGGALALKAVAGAVAGATKREAETAVRNLCKEALAHVVVRGVAVSVVGASADVVGADALDQLERTLAALGKTLKLARKTKATLLREDVKNVLAPLADVERPRHRLPSFDDVLVSVDRHREGSGLTFVPRLVRALGGAAACAAVHAALLQGARSGVLELRPKAEWVGCRQKI